MAESSTGSTEVTFAVYFCGTELYTGSTQIEGKSYDLYRGRVYGKNKEEWRP
jgi:hypothetical protein